MAWHGNTSRVIPLRPAARTERDYELEVEVHAVREENKRDGCTAVDWNMRPMRPEAVAADRIAQRRARLAPAEQGGPE